MSTLIKDAGVWKKPEMIYAKDQGIWKKPEMIYVKDQGIWKEVGGGVITPGDPFGGGFYFATFGGYNYIIADKSAEASLQWKTSTTLTSGTTSATDGWANTNDMNNSSHPAAEYCRAYRGGGFDDWFLPAKDELYLFWLSLAPGSSGTPEIFKTGGLQALNSGEYYWSSTQASPTNAWNQRFNVSYANSASKTSSLLVRPVRKIIR